MSKKMLLSIITVNLNNLNGLKKTIKSVLAQKWKEFEFIVIDGMSTDGSLEYLESQNENIDYWVSEVDKGVFEAMNKGIKQARGDYYLFLNSGDWFYNPNVLTHISMHLNNCDLLYGNIIRVYPDGKRVEEKGMKPNDISLLTFFSGSLNHQAIFIHKSLFEKYGLYDENLKIVADWKFFMIALGLNSSELKFIDEKISYYDMSGISNDNQARNKEREMVFNELIPAPIYQDYMQFMNMLPYQKLNRYKMFKEMEKNLIARKVNSFLFRGVLKLTTGKDLKDL